MEKSRARAFSCSPLSLLDRFLELVVYKRVRLTYSIYDVHKNSESVAHSVYFETWAKWLATRGMPAVRTISRNFADIKVAKLQLKVTKDEHYRRLVKA